MTWFESKVMLILMTGDQGKCWEFIVTATILFPRTRPGILLIYPLNFYRGGKTKWPVTAISFLNLRYHHILFYYRLCPILALKYKSVEFCYTLRDRKQISFGISIWNLWMIPTHDAPPHVFPETLVVSQPMGRIRRWPDELWSCKNTAAFCGPHCLQCTGGINRKEHLCRDRQN